MSTNIGSFTLGTAVRIRITCTDEDGALTDPASMSITYRRDGGGTPATYTLASAEVTKLSTGVYRFAPPTPTVAGVHRAHVVTTGAAAAGDLFHFTITPGF